MNKKYELTNETKEWLGRTLHRIRALKDFGNVKIGDLGGWIEKEENLSYCDLCWVHDNALVYGNGQVSGNGQVFGDAWVFDNGRVYGNGWVYGDGQVFGDAWVFDNGRVYGNGWVYGDAKVCGDMAIQRTRDYLTFGPAGSRNDITTFGSDANGSVLVCCGCFYGTLEEFAMAVEEKHGNDKFGEEYRAAIELAKVRFLTEETK